MQILNVKLLTTKSMIPRWCTQLRRKVHRIVQNCIIFFSMNTVKAYILNKYVNPADFVNICILRLSLKYLCYFILKCLMPFDFGKLFLGIQDRKLFWITFFYTCILWSFNLYLIKIVYWVYTGRINRKINRIKKESIDPAGLN